MPPQFCCRRNYRSSEFNFRRASSAALVSVLISFVFIPSFSRAQTSSTLGQWSAVIKWPYEAIHAHVLPTGKVMFWTRGDHSQFWNPATNVVTAAPQSGANIFCSGHTLLADGRVFVAGGHVQSYVGLPDAYTYKPSSNTWTRLPNMNDARWYPSATTLPNGDVLVVAGWIDTADNNVLPQVWQSASGSWRNLSTAQLALPFYPYMFVAPNGKVFMAGPNEATRYLNVSGTGAWNSVGNSNYGKRNWASSVMYDDGKVLLTGGTTCAF
jgi:galactose oxidase